MKSTRRAGLVLLALAAVGIALFWFDPSKCWFAPKCPFKLITGLDCPACGIQRFIHALLKGHPIQALIYNYYLAYSLPYASLFVVDWIMPDGPRKQRLTSVIENKWVVRFYVVSFLAWLVLRNILKI